MERHSKALLTPAGAAKRLAVTLRNLQHDRSTSRKIPFIKIGHLVRYDPDDLDAFIASAKVGGVA
jgi:hypothetical protein